MTERRDRFRQLYDENYDRILGFALRRTDTAEDAHDIVSEVFLAAWRRLDDVPEGARERMWLYGTARNAVANHYRGRQRQRRLSAKLRSVTRQAPDDLDPPINGDLGGVTAAFGRLHDSDREVLLLVGWEKLDSAQLAEVLGCKRTSARARLHRARKRFAAELDKEGLQHPASGRHESGRRVLARHDAEEAL